MEIKDPKTFSMKVYDRGRWITYYYEPNSTTVTRVEGPDTSEDYLYENGKWNGLTVRARGHAHTIQATDDAVVADKMPRVTIAHDARGRDTEIRRGNEVVAAVNYDADGKVRRLTIGAMKLEFSVQSEGVREVLTANGKTLITTVAKSQGKRQFPVSFDPLADKLGLSGEWRNSVHFSQSATGSLISVSDELHRPLAEIVQLGGMGAAFDTNGAPLFYDVRLKYTAMPILADHGDAFADPNTVLRGIMPDGLIIPVSGDASAYVSRPGDGAISSLWTATKDGTPFYHFIVYHEAANQRAANLSFPSVTSLKTTGNVTARRRSWTVSPLMMWECGMEEHWACDSSGSSGYCYNYYTPVYCDSGGGGGYNPPPDDSGGGGSNAGGGNHVTGDPVLMMAVNNALSSAGGKFGDTRCSQDLFKNTKLSDGTSLADVLSQRGTSAASWLTDSLRYVNGYTNGACAGHPAWTLVNDTTVNVCTSFKNMGASQGAVVLIHEELHTLGLTEKPGYPDAAMDSAQITQLVMDYCGG
jgi:hypothetical protein